MSSQGIFKVKNVKQKQIACVKKTNNVIYIFLL